MISEKLMGTWEWPNLLEPTLQVNLGLALRSRALELCWRQAEKWHGSGIQRYAPFNMVTGSDVRLNM